MRSGTVRVELIIGALLLLITAVCMAGGRNVTLAWDPNSEPGIAGYNLYCGKASGAYDRVLDCGWETRKTVGGLEGGVTYFFAVTAYTEHGVESLPSEEISYTVPLANPRTPTPPHPTPPPLLPPTPRPVPNPVEVPGPKILSQLPDRQGHIVLTWASQPGQNYEVRCKDSPGDANWTVLSRVLALDATTSWTDPQSGSLSRSYSVVLVQPPELRILSLRPEEQGRMVVTWSSQPGHDYQILCKDSLMDARWTVLSPIVRAVDTATSWTDRRPPGYSRFYRVAELQSPKTDRVFPLTLESKSSHGLAKPLISNRTDAF